MDIDVLKTGSDGNAVVINGEILIDCGVPYKTLEESWYIPKLKLVLLTHRHSDHFNSHTVGRLHDARPSLRWGMCEWMVQPVVDAGVSKRVIDVMECGTKYGYNYYNIFPVELVHDVPNCGWHIQYVYTKLFYGTDTGTLDHVEAKDYNIYCIEANHSKDDIEARIKDKLERGEFAYEFRAARNHLSQEQALDWLARNMGPNSKVVWLHQHKEKQHGKEAESEKETGHDGRRE